MVSASLKNQNGIGVISILVTVIIFLVILTGVFAMVGRTTEAAKLQQAQQDIMAIQQATRQTYATSKNYAGLRPGGMAAASGFGGLGKGKGQEKGKEQAGQEIKPDVSTDTKKLQND